MAGWLPSSLVSLTAWLDADQITGLATGAPVTQWLDASGSGNHFDASGSAPSFQPGILNGKPAVYFNGSHPQILQNTGIARNLANTIYVAANLLVPDAYRRLLSGSQDSSQFYLGGVQSNFGTFVGYGNNTWNDVAANEPQTSIAGGGFHIMGMVNDGASLRPFLNGQAQTAKNGTTLPFTGIAVGSSYPGQEWTGHVAEIVVVDATLGTDDREKLEGYLAHKWDLAGSLPADHPYKLSAPTTDEGSAAPDGFRISESGDRRVTEGGDSRITERLVLASAALAGAGTLTASGARIAPGAAALSATGSMSGAALRSTVGAASLSGIASIAGQGEGSKAGSAALLASGALAANGLRFTSGATALASVGAVTASARLTAQASADLISNGSTLTVAMRVTYGMAGLTASGTLAAVGDGQKVGAASLAATGAFTALGIRIAAGSGSMLGACSISATGVIAIPGEASLCSEGSALGAAGVTKLVGADLFGTGSMWVDGRTRRPARIDLASSSTLISGGKLIYNAAVSLTGQGTVQARGGSLIAGAADLGFAPVRRITEQGDARITEAGDYRVTLPYMTSGLIANGTLTVFAGDILVKRSDTYFDIIPFAKVAGAYVEVPLVYIKTDNAYRRAR